MIAILLVLTTLAQNEPLPTPTPFPQQDLAAEITPPPADPVPVAVDHEPSHEKLFNYYRFPLSLDVGWRPCRDCEPLDPDKPYRRDAELSLWAGYAFAPYDAKAAPFMAGGVEWIFATSSAEGTLRGRHLVIPTWRMGMQLNAIASIYGTAGVILPVGYSYGWGTHLGVGLTSPITLLLSAVCSGAMIPNVIEGAWEKFPTERGAPPTDRYVLKLGWGF